MNMHSTETPASALATLHDEIGFLLSRADSNLRHHQGLTAEGLACQDAALKLAHAEIARAVAALQIGLHLAENIR